MRDAGLLSPRTNVVHGAGLTDDWLKTLVDAAASPADRRPALQPERRGRLLRVLQDVYHHVIVDEVQDLGATK